MSRVLIPGSFDPVTKGHAELIKKAAKIFDEVVVCAFENCEKKYMFKSEDRFDMLSLVCSEIPGCRADISDGFLMDYVSENGIDFIVKGVRNVADFDYENWLAQINKSVDPDVETVLLPADSQYGFISSSVVRERIKYSKSLSGYVTDAVEAFIEAKKDR